MAIMHTIREPVILHYSAGFIAPASTGFRVYEKGGVSNSQLFILPTRQSILSSCEQKNRQSLWLEKQIIAL